MKKLIFTIGCSGSGKSTYIKKNIDSKLVVSPDEIRKKISGDISDQSQNYKIWRAVPELLRRKMEKYGIAVLDATNVDTKDRQKILNHFQDNDIKKIAIVFNIDPDEAKKRVRKDIESGIDRSNVPDYAIDRQCKKFRDGYNDIEKQFDKVIYA